MANAIFGIIPTQSTDADFRAWGSALAAQLNTFLTRVPTSNDINWSTVTKPTGTNVFQGFEVYRFNDTAQTTHPLFLKFEFGSNGSGAGFPTIRFTIAKNCAADGTLSNIIFPATQIYAVSTTGLTTNLNCYISSYGSCFALALCPSHTSATGLLLIERAIDSDASINGNGLYVGFKATSSTVAFQNYFISYSAGTANTVLGKGIFPAPLDLTTDISFANGTTTPFFPAACLNSAGLYWIPRIALGGARADCALGAVITNLLDGNNYIGMGAGASGADQRASQYSSLLMRW